MTNATAREVTALVLYRFDCADSHRADLGEVVAELAKRVRDSSGSLWGDVGETAAGFSVLAEWRSSADLEAFEADKETRKSLETAEIHTISPPSRRVFSSAE